MTIADTTTAQTLRDQAAAHRAAASESFERSDTDGFLSQWASDITGRKLSMEADIVEKGGKWTFPALFDADGNLVPAKFVKTQFGYAWGILSDENDLHSRFSGWFSPSKASTPAKRTAANLKKGFRVGIVLAPARAEIGGSGRGLAGAASCYVYAKRTDGGFSRDVEVVQIDGLVGGNRDDNWY